MAAVGVGADSTIECATFGGDEYLVLRCSGDSDVGCGVFLDRVRGLAGQCGDRLGLASGFQSTLVLFQVPSGGRVLNDGKADYVFISDSSDASCQPLALSLNEVHRVVDFYNNGTLTCTGDSVLFSPSCRTAANGLNRAVALYSDDTSGWNDCELASFSTTGTTSASLTVTATGTTTASSTASSSAATTATSSVSSTISITGTSSQSSTASSTATTALVGELKCFGSGDQVVGTDDPGICGQQAAALGVLLANCGATTAGSKLGCINGLVQITDHTVAAKTSAASNLDKLVNLVAYETTHDLDIQFDFTLFGKLKVISPLCSRTVSNLNTAISTYGSDPDSELAQRCLQTSQTSTASSTASSTISTTFPAGHVTCIDQLGNTFLGVLAQNGCRNQIKHIEGLIEVCPHEESTKVPECTPGINSGEQVFEVADDCFKTAKVFNHVVHELSETAAITDAVGCLLSRFLTIKKEVSTDTF